MNSLVSIICTSYNHAPYIERSLNSLIHQSYKNIEIIIVDNASEDNSVQVIEKWLKSNPSILFIKNKKNLGNNKSFNQAVKIAKGDFLIDLAADDVILENAIEKQIEAFKKNPTAGLVFGNANIIDENDVFLHHHFETDDKGHVLNKSIHYTNYISILKGGNCMCSVSAMYHRKKFDELNGYDEDLAYEDLDFWIRLSRKYTFVYIDEPLVEKRYLTNSQLSFFYKKNSYSKKINTSTYKILKKAYSLNKNKEEYFALLKRVHHEIIHNYKLSNYILLLKLLVLKIKIHFKLLFN